MIFRALAALAAFTLAAGASAAEWEFSGYLGYQSAPPSNVEGFHPDTGPFDAEMNWRGEWDELPPYYGVRVTYWTSETIGYSLELTHAKVDAPRKDTVPIGFDDLEFTNGLNIVTANIHRRWPDAWQGLSPYIGGGIGVSVPHVDVLTSTGIQTLGFQLAGPAARIFAGASYDLNETWSVYAEYQMTYSVNETDLDGGGSLDSNVLTNALNIGLSYRF